ncbi:MAG: FG-GAP-like repeat-containing protein [Bacteroidota bacterium]
MNRCLYISMLFCLLASASCDGPSVQEKTPTKAPFRRLAATETGVDFVNSIENTKEFNIFRYRNFYNGGGVGVGDLNNDGLPDLFFTANMGDNRLYLNKGDFKFEDITEKAGIACGEKWSTGLAMVDINADGLLDIYVCNAGFRKGVDQKNNLFINNGDLTFTDKAAEYGLDENGYTTHAAFFDYDLDGDLDVYILNNSFMPVNTLNYSNKRELPSEKWPVKDFLKGGGDKLLRNEGGRFVDATSESGIYSSLIGFGLGITIGDVNGDHWPDLYVSNDFFERDYLYINQKDGTFKEDIKNWMRHLSMFSMGADMADVNNDGLPEIFVTDMLPDDDVRLKTTTTFDNYNIYEMKLRRDFYYQFMQNTLQLNQKNDHFKEIAFYSGVSSSDWSWGALMFDFNSDGYRDIYVCNGVYQDVTNQDFIDFFANEVIQKMVLSDEKEKVDKIIEKMPSTPLPNKLFVNDGQLKFEDLQLSEAFNPPSFSNGAAYGDLDGDGDLDLVVNNLNQEAFVFENTSIADGAGPGYLKFILEQQDANRNAIGAKCIVYAGSETMASELIPTRGFQSSVTYSQVFGLGDRTVDSVHIIWPDLQQTLLLDVQTDTTYRIVKEQAARKPMQVAETATEALLIPQAEDFEKHTEDNFVDFYAEGMTFKKMSRQGPCLTVGDLNGDGLEDVFVGGAVGQSGQIYLQTSEGFQRQPTSGLEAEEKFEDTAAALADLDGDGDLDLIVGSGGNHDQLGSRVMHDRVYFNDGQANFRLEGGAFPRNGLNTSCIVPMDYDKDGDQDLFVFSNSVPGIYGINSRNYLYRNKGKGLFEDVTESVAPALLKNGLINEAIFTPLTKDAAPSLIVAGEWMGIEVYQYNGKQFKAVKTSLDQYKGWWESIQAADMDGDGDQDLVLGNSGMNAYLANPKFLPIRLWLSDFDENGTVDKILTRQVNAKDVPVLVKKELTDQIISLKKQNTRHAEYAKKGIRDLFSKEVLNKATKKEAGYFYSAIAWNNGDGTFELKKLPHEAQLTSINAFLLDDLNDDGLPDIIAGNNNFGFTPQFSRIDAGRGQVLLNQGQRSFRLLNSRESGLDITGQVQDVASVEWKGQSCFIFGVNDGVPQILCRSN